LHGEEVEVKLRFRRALPSAVVLLLLFSMLLVLWVPPVHASAPSLIEIFNNLGFTNVAQVSIGTFPAGTYNITLYAKFGGNNQQHIDMNEIDYYQVNTSTFNVLFTPSEPTIFGYVTPPLTKTFSTGYQFGLSFLSYKDTRYYTESNLNPDGIPQVEIFVNNNDPTMLLFGFDENSNGCYNGTTGDGDFNAMVFSLQAQFYLNVVSAYDTPSGQGWYGNGTNAFASLATGLVDQGNGTRRVFTQWSGDASGTNFANSSAILMNQNRTALAVWNTQYYLTVDTSPTGLVTIPGGWYNQCANTTLTAPAVTGYALVYWDVDGVSQGNGNNPITVGMCGPHTATAHYSPTYTLQIVAGPGGSTNPIPGTYNPIVGSTVQVTAVPSAKYGLDYWKLDGTNVGSSNPYNVLMNENHTLEAVFKALPPPTVSIYPNSALISVGQNVYFSSTVASGTPPYAYQWYLNGNPVTGATSSTWTFTTNTAGTYAVYLKITDSATNTAQSKTASVTVITVTVGGTSFAYTKVQSVNPLALSLGALAALTLFFVSVRRKTRKRN